MLVLERFIDGKPRLEFKYKIQSGPTTVKSYGLALARCIRLPSSLINRAEELVDKVIDETFVLNEEAGKCRAADETVNSSVIPEAIAELDKDVIDLYSYILLLMSTNQEDLDDWINLDTINQKVESLINKMSPELKEMIQSSSLEDVISILNSSKSSA